MAITLQRDVDEAALLTSKHPDAMLLWWAKPSWEGIAGLRDVAAALDVHVLAGCQVESLYGLGVLSSLRALRIGAGVTLRGFGAIRECPNLQALSVAGDLTRLDAHLLSGLPRLHVLELHNGSGGTLALDGLVSNRELKCLRLKGFTEVSGVGALAELPLLNYLSISGISLAEYEGVGRMFNLNHLAVIVPDGGDLAPLADLRELQSLTLHRRQGEFNVGPLADLPELSVLSLSWEQGGPGRLDALEQVRTLSLYGRMDEQAIAALGRLPNLERLSLRGCGGVSNIGPLGEATSLRFVDLSLLPLNGVSMAPIAKMGMLEVIRCEYMPRLTALPDLGGTGRLRELSFAECQNLADISGLRGSLSQVRAVDLRGCESLADASALSDSQHVEMVGLAGCGNIAGIDWLSAKARLRVLDMEDCAKVSDLGPLRSAKALERLSLAYCTSVIDLSPLSGLPQLRELDVSHCLGITDFGPLANLESLEHLAMRWCPQVKDLGMLAECHRLMTVDLRDTQVRDVAALKDLQNLRCVDLRGNAAVADYPVLAHLVRRGVVVLVDDDKVRELSKYVK